MTAETAGRRAQAGALGCKLATLQSRSLGTNACLVAAPVMFCLLLLVLQFAINHALSSSEFTCGCQCTACCWEGNPANCSVMHNTTCPFQCLRHNTSRCGVEFSSGVQAAFCEVPHPSIWPPITQVPPTAQRAAPARPALTILHTPGSNASLSAAATAAMLPPPVLQASTLLAANAHLASFSTEMGSAGNMLPGEVAAMLGLARLGSATPLPGAVGLYADTAVVGSNKNLDMMWPAGTCRQLGLAGRTDTPLNAVLQAIVNASNPPAAAALLNRRLQDLADAAAASGSALAQITRVAVNCSDVVLAAMPSSARLQRALYCGNARARCGNGTRVATNSYAAGIEWRNTSATVFAPLLLFNDSFAIAGEDVGTNYVRAPAPLLNMAVNGFLRATLGPGTSAELVGLGSLPKAPLVAEHDFTAAISAVLGCWVLQLLFPVFVHQLVYEKERGLRLMQKQHGLGDAAYWSVHAAWFAALYLVFAAAFALLGGITGLHMFTLNSPGIQVVLYVLWGCTLIALSFFTSCFFSSARTAAVACFLAVFASGLLGFMLLRYLLDLEAVDARQSWWAVFLEVIPQLALYRGLYELGAYGSLGAYRGSHGMIPASLSDANNGMAHAWVILAGSSVLLTLAAWWCEQVFASGTGNRRHPLFFLRVLWRQPPGCRQSTALAANATAATSMAISKGALPVTDPHAAPRSPRGAASGLQAADTPVRGRRGTPAGLLSKLAPVSWRAPQHTPPAGGHPSDSCSSLDVLPHRPAAGDAAAAAACCGSAAAWWTANGQLVRVQAEPADVAAEAARVAALSADDCSTALVIRGLHKIYRARDGQPPKLAVQRLDLAVGRGECFGLLGPNGAGKSTIFKMLTGLIRPTSGTALVAGLDVARDMARVFGCMGVCPQHDLLWDALTGREHLLFYGRLKGLTGAALDAAVHAGLESVSLASGGVPNKRAGSYSGGMQRRLSVAISFMGDPCVVYLDEPSTGLDPASRRTLWQAIVAAKPGRAILLTTHSMEEAEMLCDRLGIFVDGRLACIGRPLDITTRFCGFLLLTLTVAPGQDAAARELVHALCPGALLTYSVGGTLKFELSTSKVSIPRGFAAMAAAAATSAGQQPDTQQQQQQQQPSLDIVDWSVASASLEDAFIRFSRRWSRPAAAK